MRSDRSTRSAFGDWWGDIFEPEQASGVRVTASNMKKLSGISRGIRLISRSVAKLPFEVIDRATREQARTHVAWPLLRTRANLLPMSSFQFVQLMQARAILKGNAYAYIRTNGLGEPVELLPLDPDYVTPFRENGRTKYLVTIGGTLDDIQSVAAIRELDADQVLHIAGLGWDGIKGDGLLNYGAKTLGLEIAQEEYASRYFKQASDPKIVIEVPDAMGDKAYGRLKTYWQNRNAGLENVHKTAILEEGAKAKPLFLNPAESQLLGSRQFGLVQIANLLDLPVHKIGGEGRTSFNSLELENQSFLDDCLDAWLRTWETECDLKLLSNAEQRDGRFYCEFKRSALVRADQTRTANALRQYVGAPIMAINEGRARLNMPPIEGGNELLMPLNMVPASAVPEPEPESPETTERHHVAPDLRTAEDLAETSARDKALETIAEDTIRRMVSRVTNSAGRAADGNNRTENKWQTFLDTLDEKHGGPVRSAFEPLEALFDAPEARLTDWLLHSVPTQMIAGKRGDDLIDLIDVLVIEGVAKLTGSK